MGGRRGLRPPRGHPRRHHGQHSRRRAIRLRGNHAIPRGSSASSCTTLRPTVPKRGWSESLSAAGSFERLPFSRPCTDTGSTSAASSGCLQRPRPSRRRGVWALRGPHRRCPAQARAAQPLRHSTGRSPGAASMRLVFPDRPQSSFPISAQDCFARPHGRRINPPSIHLDTSSSNGWTKFHARLTLTDVFRQALAVAGATRILFGTDSSFFPRGWQRPVFDGQRHIVEELGLPEADRSGLFHENFDRLFPQL